jgi:hypothetical protein
MSIVRSARDDSGPIARARITPSSTVISSPTAGVKAGFGFGGPEISYTREQLEQSVALGRVDAIERTCLDRIPCRREFGVHPAPRSGYLRDPDPPIRRTHCPHDEPTLLKAVEYRDQRRFIHAHDLAELSLRALWAIVERGKHQPITNVRQTHVNSCTVELDRHPLSRGMQQKRQINRTKQRHHLVAAARVLSGSHATRL